MALVDVRFSWSERRLPREVQELIDEAGDRIEDFIAERSARVSGFVPSDFDRVYPALAAIDDQRLTSGNAFCELGSGFGVVTLLAALLEFDAYGIEIEGSLVAEAQKLAEDFDLPAEFIEGSYIPEEGEEIVRNLYTNDNVWLPGHAQPAWPKIGMLPRDFDLIYAFPWPEEEELVATLFDEFGATGALLLTFEQLGGVRLRRKVVRR